MSAVKASLFISATLLLSIPAIADTVGISKYRYQYRISGKSASVSFQEYSPDGCGYSGGDLYFFTESAGSGGSIGSISLYQYNWCGEVYTERYGSSEINLNSLSISKDILSASAQGTGSINWNEYSNGQYASYQENIEIGVTVVGVGETTDSRYSTHTSYPGPWGKASSTYRSSGTYRNAETTGAISGDMVTNVIINAENSSSQLSNSKSATLTLE